MSFVLEAAFVITAIAVIAISLRLAKGNLIAAQTLSRTTIFLLWSAGILSGLLTLAALASAAWGMDTRLPWGLGVYMYLIPALSLPAFLLLIFSSLRALSRVLWFLTVASAFAFYFGDRAERIASGMQPIADRMDILGMFLNFFTILFVFISILVQLAAVCKLREQRQTNTAIQSN
jgi:hypothetical protein